MFRLVYLLICNNADSVLLWRLFYHINFVIILFKNLITYNLLIDWVLQASEKIGNGDIDAEAIYKEIQSIFCWVDSLDKYTLMRQLKKYNHNPCGSLEVLKKRLKACLQKKKLSSANIYSNNVKTLYPFYVVLDFEATCNEVNPSDYR